MRLKTPLMRHQIPPVEKLERMKVGGLLMDMGTGKSRVTIELSARREKRIDKVMWFCPVSLKETVRREIDKHVENPRINVFDDKTCLRTLDRSAFWHVIGIESMSSSRRVLLAASELATDRTEMVLDESTYAKNAFAKRTEWLTRLGEKVRYRLINTGTPMTQGIVDLYAQMRFLSPEILGYNSFYSFAANHLEYDKDHPGRVIRAHNSALLAAKIAPYVYQVSKDDAGLNLPAKLYSRRWCLMTPTQRDVYLQAKAEILSEIDQYPEEWWHTATIYRMFTALQSIICGFWHRTTWAYREKTSDELIELPHNRLELLEGVLNAIPAGEKVILWTKFHYCIRQITGLLDEEFGTDGWETYNGDLSPRLRSEALDRWRNDKRFLVMTPGSGGHGLTLNEAAYVVYYDNGFKFSERLQSEDRNHRIGQTRKVTYIDIGCSRSIDERILESHDEKGNLLAIFQRQVNQVKEFRTRKQALRQMIEEL